MSRVVDHAGPYRLLEEIGVGGMGEVHLALDPEGRTVAVKVLHPAVARDAAARRRLEREAETARLVRGPHVAEVLDADFHAPRPYIVTRYVQGRSLEAVVRDHGALRGAALVRLARGLARALHAIHSAGVVHRDLKPSNVILVDGRPVVIDFGLAQPFDATRLTLTGTAVGTPGYLAPEILDGDRAGPAADIFAWAATVTFAATGMSPYGRGPVQAVLSRALRGRFDVSALPEAIRPLTAAALDPDESRRPTTVEILASLDHDDTRVFRPSDHRPDDQRHPRHKAGRRRPSDQPAVEADRPQSPGSPAVQADKRRSPGSPVVEADRRRSSGSPGVESDGRRSSGSRDDAAGRRGSTVGEGISRPIEVARSAAHRRPWLGVAVSLPAPVVCYAAPTLAAGLMLTGCGLVYLRDAVVRSRRLLRASRGGRLAQLGGALAVLVAFPLQVVIRLLALLVVVAVGFGGLAVVTETALPGARGWALAAGLLAVSAGVVRAWFQRGRAPVHRVGVPLLMAGGLALVAIVLHSPLWWPLAR